MDAKHFNELSGVSREICDHANDRIANYCAQQYCAVENDTTEQQLRDYLFIAEESASFILGSALALLDASSQEKEIRTFTESLRRAIRFMQPKAGEKISPS